MKIVLLGASGQLGSEWQVFLGDLARNEQVVHPYTSAQLDITDQDALSRELRAKNPDLIINCAAYTDVDGAEENKQLAQKVNVEAVDSLAELSAELDCMLIHFSTDYVFPGTLEDRTNFPNGYSEDHPTDPINEYGRTKLQGEEKVRSSGCNYLIIRVAWLCGALGSNFVKTMLKLGRERDELQVVDDQWGSPTFTAEVVFNSWQLLKAEQTGTFHITSEGLLTWHNFACTIFELAGLEVNVEPVPSDQFPTAATRPYFSKLNTQKAQTIEGTNILDWQSGLEAMLDQLGTPDN